MNNSDKNSNPHTIVQILDYQIVSTVYSGSRTLVYRGVRTCDQLPVVIKLLKNDYPTFSELVQFRNQYTIAKNLNSPLIIQTYSLEAYKNGYALIMEDFGGISLHEWAVKEENTLSLREFLGIAIALCNTLDILYRDRIIHKDIKPSNILINPETKQIKLIDFSIASLLPRETQSLMNPNVLEGTLAYISPEQTGRMNRGIDYRTDFYSLGVTFYELLTGELPFQSNEPMELVHCHIAKATPLVHEINPQIPSVISEIVNKMMAKNAEDRYQSALGLKFDLENCLHQLQNSGEIHSFEIARRDVCDRFLIPEKLYGRETEVNQLLTAFERVSLGATEMMLVAGFSGIGKTAVVNEVHKPIVRQRGYFIKGKYDQFQRNIPFSAFVQAFRDLMGQLLSESDRQIQSWKTQILAAVGDNGQVLIDVIPELENIIGSQPKARELSGSAAQNRFNLLLPKFVQIFTSIEHPLVMFLDDLQWADSASLNLLKLLMSETGHLLILGAYRDNEVSPAHPFILTVDELVKTGATVKTITLSPLSRVDLNQLVADTLSCELSQAQPLTELVYKKTKGNPFFATQFLKALHDDKLISFNWEIQHWQCDIAQVSALAITDDVVEFMALQLHKLPTETQKMLKLAACIGAQFELNTLVIVSEKSAVSTATALWKALQEGLVIPTTKIYKFFTQSDSKEAFTASANPTYQFLHDRVQQAAYSLIPDEQKQSAHLKIGQLLLAHTSVAEKDEKLFEIVNQLNIGKSLIVDPCEQIELAKLNLKAGQKARAATAYTAAFEYCTTGINLLAEDRWQTQYELTLALYEAATEAAYLSGNFEQMKQLAAVIIEHSRNLLDTVKVYEVQIQAAQAQHQFIEAVQIALKTVERLGTSFPEQPSQLDIAKAFEATKSILAGRQPLDLITLPEMTDPNKLAALRILKSVSSSAFVATPALLPFIVLEQVNLSVQYGNTSFSANGYAYYGLILCGVVGDIDCGYQFAQLALLLLEHFNAREMKARVYVGIHCSVWHWKEPLKNSLPFLREGYQVGLETGDLEAAAICGLIYIMYCWFLGRELSDLSRESAAFRTQLAHLNQEGLVSHLTVFQQAILNTIGDAAEPWQLSGDAFDREEIVPVLERSGNQTALYYFYASQLGLCYLFGKFELAVSAAIIAENYIGGATGLFIVTVCYTYDSLAHLAIYSQVSEVQQQHILQRVAKNQEKMKKWADHAPENHLHKFYLVEAERCRVLGHKSEALEFYDRAISLAKENQFLNEEALANELTAKFYLEWGKEKVAQVYAIEAYYAYSRWGAKAKVDDLEKRYSQLLAPILQQPRSSTSFQGTITKGTIAPTQSSSSVSEALDLATLLKASQAISEEIELNKLLTTLLKIVITNAGATKSVLLLKQEQYLQVAALVEEGQEPQILPSMPLELSQDVAISLVHIVKRSLASLVLVDARINPQFAGDRYIEQHQPKSVLCSPILNQGKLIGILYLENNLTVGAFTSDRVELLNMLCSQAAISLENARLYSLSQQYAQQLEQSLENLRASNSRFEKLVDNVPGIVYQARITTDGVMSLLYFSANCYELYEITAEQAMNNVQLILDIIHPEDAASYQQSISDSIQKLTPFEWSGRMITPSGIVKWIHTEARIHKLADGSMVLDGLVIDISDRKRIEAERQQKSLALEKTLRELQKAQIQLIQGEKMSALGNLVAGVAHEINNPLGFLSGNIQPALDYINDVFGLLDLVQQKYPQLDPEIQEEIETIELDYIREDLPKLVGSMREGVKRIQDISVSLRTFSRADSDRPVACNIHDGIDSTIMILKHRLKANENRPEIQIIKNYGALPKIECYAGQLNQVFMNIFGNAIEAFDELNIGRSYAEIQANPNQIIVKTELSGDGQQVIIRIEDNGVGMTEAVRERVFDDLFTTKGVGKGTGLGLAIARQIVEEKHGGKLICNSTLGVGTEFAIALSLKK